MDKLEKLQSRYKKASDALLTLEQAIVNMGKVETIAKLSNEYPENIYKTFRDSLIQRFEYTFDVTWKYISEYLDFEGKKTEIKTPKNIFRECLKANLLSDEEVRLALQMVDHRNLTTHGYDEPLIESIVKQIPEYYQLLEKLLQKTKK
jgi:nucleotidyltransferase substrate binding protein (TIGR01987 family)